MGRKDAFTLLVIGAVIFFWEDIFKLITPEVKNTAEKDFAVYGSTETMDEYCRYVIYKPMSFVGLHSDSTLMKNYCYSGDSSYWDDKPHETGHVFAQEQAKEYKERKKEEGKVAELKNITIILRNSTVAEIDTNISDASDEVAVFPPPLSAPTANSASSISSTGFTANWSELTRATGYYFDLATDSSFVSFVSGYDNLDVGNVVSLAITGLSKGANYYYRVRGYNNVNTSPSSSTILGQTPRWFLPSKDEIYALYTVLHLFRIGNFTIGKFYWTSSERNATNCYRLLFNTGQDDYVGKNDNNYVTRGIRSFISSVSYELRDVGPAGGWIFIKINNGNGTYTYYECGSSDLSVTQVWSNITNILIGTTGTAVGTGQSNTIAIINQVGHTTSAAELCDNQ